MSSSIQRRESGKPVKFDPLQTKTRNSEADAVIAHAKRVKDWPMLDRAVVVKIDELCAFVEWWGQTVTPNQIGPGRGKRGRKVSSGRRILSLSDAEKQTGIKNQQVSRWRRKRKDPEKWAEDIKAAAKRRSVDDTLETTAIKWTGDPESYTPSEYVDAAREVMGGIDLDPASDEIAQAVVKAATWYTRKDDGLKQAWQGRVFLNPPYAYPAVQDFINKLLSSLEEGTVTQAVLLTNNNTDTKWWQRAARLSEGVCFTAGRIHFFKPDGSQSQPTNGQTFFYFGQAGALFQQVFSEFGLVMEVVRDHSLS